MAMEIKGFIRKNSFLRYIDLVVGWEAEEGSTAFLEMPGRMLVSDIRNNDDGSLRGVGLVRCSEGYDFIESICLTTEQATELRDALAILLDDNTKQAAEDEV